MKICCHCHRELDESCFSKKSSEKDGLRRECRECMREYRIKYITENREEYLKKRREYDAKNADKKKEYRKRNYERHGKEQKERQKKYFEENRERYLEMQRKSEEKRKGTRGEYRKAYYQKNRERILDNAKKYGKKHAAERREYSKKYQKERRESDELFRLRQDLRNLFGAMYRKNGWSKECRTKKLVGCTFEEAKAHLEQTWFENYGTPYNGEPVHIDHIVPLATAKTNEEAERLCHISNLQYLKPSDNMSKQDKLDWCVKSKKSVV
jgi:hypothetical protein